MRVEILFFGITRDISGSRNLKIDLGQASSVGELRAAMEISYPALRTLKQYAVAVNNEYAADEVAIAEGDEIAILPPVSGG